MRCLNARRMNQRRMRVWHSAGPYAANQDLMDLMDFQELSESRILADLADDADLGVFWVED